MKVSRRNLLAAAGTGAVVGLAGAGERGCADRLDAFWIWRPSARAHAERLVAAIPHAQRREGSHLVAEEFEHEFAPGCKAKVWGYNGTTPGPTIEAVEGDRVRLLVTNKLGEPTTMHWHGIILPSGMDGIAGLSQPPIMPGETFAHEFTLQQHGTHMYHPHADELTQMAMGMMGMFIIHPRNGDEVPVQRDYCFTAPQLGIAPGYVSPRSGDHARLRSLDLQQQGVPCDRVSRRAHGRPSAYSHGKSVDVESPVAPPWGRVLRHRL